MRRPHYFCLDCEASGPTPGHYNMLSIGIVAVAEQGGDWEIGEPWYRELMPVFPGVDPGAVAVCGLDMARLKREGMAPAAALEELTAWVEAQTPAGREPVFVGHNAPFDWMMVRWYYENFGLQNPFGYKALDTKALAMGVLGLDWLASNKEVLAERLELPEVETGKVHHAGYDAWYQAHILVGLLRAQQAR